MAYDSRTQAAAVERHLVNAQHVTLTSISHQGHDLPAILGLADAVLAAEGCCSLQKPGEQEGLRA